MMCLPVKPCVNLIKYIPYTHTHTYVNFKILRRFVCDYHGEPLRSYEMGLYRTTDVVRYQQYGTPSGSSTALCSIQHLLCTHSTLSAQGTPYVLVVEYTVRCCKMNAAWQYSTSRTTSPLLQKLYGSTVCLQGQQSTGNTPIALLVPQSHFHRSGEVPRGNPIQTYVYF